MSETVRTSFEIFLVGDADGYYEVGITEEDAFRRYFDSYEIDGSTRLMSLLAHASFPPRQVTEINVPEGAATIVTAEVARQYSEGDEP